MKLLLQLLLIPIIILSSGFTIGDDKHCKYNCFTTQEKLEYRVHYGFINAGEAKIEISPSLYRVNNQICYKAVVSGKSSGAFDMALRIRDTWESYIDTTTRIPHRTFRNIEEGKYRLKEYVFFDTQKGVATVERHYKGEKKYIDYKVPSNVQDIVSGYFYLRNINYDKLKVNDTIAVNAFFEDKLYAFSVKFLGKSKVDTKFGDIKAIQLSPIMPDNDLFEGGNSIRVWLSDDQNKIPLKIEADMFVGAVEMDLKSYKGLKYPINFQ